ncbi:hypothetical protein HNP84_000446 [Thermocatellispora tengchongensis]|uniref:Uncharacterized protein n=1 Tax=Thermocatellispora tengchongensis TaxID=1073253 RepID=A0A840NT55_9ACTN|nr:DUF6412 domain-containing protein [Thermocatellispora tengchongensis]MBB5130758.1 hypothetical protein [Thermocatellispora tengchongensis]
MHAPRLYLLLLLAVAVLGGAAGDPRGMLAGAAVAGLSVLLLAWAARALRAEPRADPWTPLSARDRARRTTFVRQRDPDAAGRPRPRAPSAGPAPA